MSFYLHNPEIQDHELHWVELYDELLRRGYELRGRYKPGWTPEPEPDFMQAMREDIPMPENNHSMTPMVSVTSWLQRS